MGGFAFYDANGKFLYHLWDPRFSDYFQENSEGKDEQEKMLRKLQNSIHGKIDAACQATSCETAPCEETISAPSANGTSSVFNETSWEEIRREEIPWEKTVNAWHSPNDIPSTVGGTSSEEIPLKETVSAHSVNSIPSF